MILQHLTPRNGTPMNKWGKERTLPSWHRLASSPSMNRSSQGFKQEDKYLRFSTPSILHPSQTAMSLITSYLSHFALLRLSHQQLVSSTCTPSHLTLLDPPSIQGITTPNDLPLSMTLRPNFTWIRTQALSVHSQHCKIPNCKTQRQFLKKINVSDGTLEYVFDTTADWQTRSPCSLPDFGP